MTTIKAENSDNVSQHNTRIVLADDHALVRAGIRALLEKIDGVEVLAEAGDGREALQLGRDLKPDVMLLDISMPGLSGLEVLTEVRRSVPEINVIILTVHKTEDYAEHALRLGAAGFISKSAASQELESALQTVMRGERYVSVAVSGQKGEFATGAVRPHASGLTPRQLEVLEMIAKGYSTKDIAKVLDISAKTVETHRAQLMDRLRIYDVAGLVRYAIRTGIVRIDD